jgi:hypothetical protein
MVMDSALTTLGADGLRRLQALQSDAVSAVTERFHAAHGPVYEQFGPHGRDACRQDLSFHLELLRPVLEFGLLQPMVDYLCWLGSVLAARAIPVDHVGLSLEWLAAFFRGSCARKQPRLRRRAAQARPVELRVEAARGEARRSIVDRHSHGRRQSPPAAAGAGTGDQAR